MMITDDDYLDDFYNYGDVHDNNLRPPDKPAPKNHYNGMKIMMIPDKPALKNHHILMKIMIIFVLGLQKSLRQKSISLQ